MDPPCKRGGSNPNYNPNGGGGGYSLDSVTSAFGTAFFLVWE
jgi:hypothetical protein